MIRTTKTKHKGEVGAILCSDIHLREDTPVCRTDNFQEAMWKKLDFISALQRLHECKVLCGGDLYNHWKPSPYLLSETIKHIPDKFYTVYGQHDLPQHNLDLAYKSGIRTLEMANKLWAIRPSDMFDFCNWNEEPINIGESVLVWHHTVTHGKSNFIGDPAEDILDRYPDYDLILTGDNHKPFVVEKDGRLLVNPGSMMRMTADQADHKPRIYLWYPESNTVEPIYLPIEEGVINREHIDKVEQRNERLEAFVSRLNSKWKVTLSFEDNLKAFQTKNKVRQSVMEIIYKSIEI